jgi:hypothetical protein
MKNTELRIGNYIEIYGKVEKVVDVLCDCVNTLNIEGAHYGLANPIPLTGDWFVSFGFESQYDKMTNITKLNLYNTPFSYVQGKFVVNTGTGDFCVYIDKVHQLQNLYFALTGEELKIKN